MNTRFKPPKDSEIYTPAQLFEVAGNGSVTKTFRGVSGHEFGFNRIIIGSTAPTQMRVKAVLNGDKTIFDNVHISALKNLFLHRSLLSPFVIEDTNNLEITITDESGAAQKANVMLAGMDHIGLRAFRQHQVAKFGKVLKPVFLYGSDTINANQVDKQIEIKKKAKPVIFTGMQVGSDSLSNVLVSMAIDTDEIKSQVFAEQVNDEFLSMRSIIPYELSATVPFWLYATNLDGANPHNLSFIAEAYLK